MNHVAQAENSAIATDSTGTVKKSQEIPYVNRRPYLVYICTVKSSVLDSRPLTVPLLAAIFKLPIRRCPNKKSEQRGLTVSLKAAKETRQTLLSRPKTLWSEMVPRKTSEVSQQNRPLESSLKISTVSLILQNMLSATLPRTPQTSTQKTPIWTYSKTRSDTLTMLM